MSFVTILYYDCTICGVVGGYTNYFKLAHSPAKIQLLCVILSVYICERMLTFKFA